MEPRLSERMVIRLPARISTAQFSSPSFSDPFRSVSQTVTSLVAWMLGSPFAVTGSM